MIKFVAYLYIFKLSHLWYGTSDTKLS